MESASQSRPIPQLSLDTHSLQIALPYCTFLDLQAYKRDLRSSLAQGMVPPLQNHLSWAWDANQWSFPHRFFFLIFTPTIAVNPPFKPSASFLHHHSPEISIRSLFHRERQSRTLQTVSQTVMLSFPISVPLFSGSHCILLQTLSTLLRQPLPSSSQTCSNLNLTARRKQKNLTWPHISLPTLPNFSKEQPAL